MELTDQINVHILETIKAIKKDDKFVPNNTKKNVKGFIAALEKLAEEYKTGSFADDFLESNRWKHFLYAIPIGAVFSILCVLGCASGMEFKDKQWGGIWDWKDWGWTMFGGIIGQIIQGLILINIF